MAIFFHGHLRKVLMKCNVRFFIRFFDDWSHLLDSCKILSGDYFLFSRQVPIWLMEVLSNDLIQLLLRLKGEYGARNFPVTLFSV
jgi:hypothetical protein